MSFSDNTKLIFKASNLPNPNWGLSRPSETNPTSNFEASDKTVFTQYSLWTD